jgi:hypothetical protein
LKKKFRSQQNRFFDLNDTIFNIFSQIIESNFAKEFVIKMKEFKVRRSPNLAQPSIEHSGKW